MTMKMMKTPSFSVVIISKNESETLPRMVGSLKEFQDRGGEIILCDTGSTDKTAEVARSMGCKVTEVGDRFKINIDAQLADEINKKFVVDGDLSVVTAGESLFDFASARNYAATLSSNDFIFTPDSDEIWTKFDIDKINECIENGVEQLEYNFCFSHQPDGSPGIKFAHCKAYDRRKLEWKGIIHEILSGTAKKQFLGEEFLYLEHFQNEKTNRTGYLKGLAVDCWLHPENDRNSHYFARELMYKHHFNSAIKEFFNHISMNKWPTEASQSMLYVGDCYKYLGDIGKAFEYWIKSFEKEARREPLMRLAEYCFERQMYKQAIAYAEAALTITELPFYSNHVPYYTDIPHMILYVSYWWAGDKENSKEHWKKALEFCPNNHKYIDDKKYYL